jgi:prepilin-type N-terminal cleavage/methylation domain-containing protein
VAAGVGTPALQGFTLVEVLIALVVLMVGIYAMLRIFPRGYSAIQFTEQRTTAALLAEAELNRWRLQPDALPEAVVATDYSGEAIPAALTDDAANLRGILVYGERAARLPGTTDYTVLALSDTDVALLDRTARALIYNPADLTPSQFDAALDPPPPPPADQRLRPARLHPGWEPNSLYLPRTVIGERIDIRRLSTTQLGVPFYLLSHAPLDVLRYWDDPTTPDNNPKEKSSYVDIYDARPWTYVPPGVEGGLKEREFTYDRDSGTMTFGPAQPPAWARSFKVDYTNPASLLRVFGATAEVEAGTNTPKPGSWAVPGVDPGSIQVHERMIGLSDEEYAAYRANPALWTRKNTYGVNTETSVTGKIEFSPLLQFQPQPGDVSLAKVDYRVRDWQIMVFDVEVPGDGVVQLPVRGIKGPTYTNPPRQDQPQEIARGLKLYWDPMTQQWQTRDRQDPSTWAYVVAVDRQTGDILTDHQETVVLPWPQWAQERLRRFRVNYRDSLLFFNYGDWQVAAGTWRSDLERNATIGSRELQSRTGRTFRIFCRAEGDWAVQVSLASRLYARSGTPSDGPLPGGVPLGGVGQDTPNTYAWRTDKNPRQLYFPLSDLGQVVAVDYYTDEGGVTRYVIGEVRSIAGPDVTDLGQWACRLSGGGLAHTPNAWGPVIVRGLSVRARVSWVGPGRAATLQDIIQAYYDTYQAPGRSGRTVLPRPSLNESWHQMTVTTYLTRVPL